MKYFGAHKCAEGSFLGHCGSYWISFFNGHSVQHPTIQWKQPLSFVSSHSQALEHFNQLTVDTQCPWAIQLLIHSNHFLFFIFKDAEHAQTVWESENPLLLEALFLWHCTTKRCSFDPRGNLMRLWRKSQARAIKGDVVKVIQWVRVIDGHEDECK